MGSRYRFQIKPATLNGLEVVNWASQDGRLTATHGWLDGNVAFLTVGAPIADTLTPRPKANLADSPLFHTGVPRELTPNNGHVFYQSRSSGG
ncbi:DUF3352 domain-containing protein [Neosynechococcus sphagnicola]|uniref:DUF3352 domain-containing protein n=1 Tax=Neosynechococcus sphagnicola TaxID=1501145 RepID=UPI00068A71F8|nr:DUF3352 domain-containing protein [Neosynechococcus sphagnicola]